MRKHSGEATSIQELVYWSSTEVKVPCCQSALLGSEDARAGRQADFLHAAPAWLLATAHRGVAMAMTEAQCSRGLWRAFRLVKSRFPQTETFKSSSQPVSIYSLNVPSPQLLLHTFLSVSPQPGPSAAGLLTAQQPQQLYSDDTTGTTSFIFISKQLFPSMP